MVRTEKNKLIIEVEIDPNENAAEKLQDFQGAIIEAIQFFNYNDFGTNPPFYYLLELLKATLPTFEQQKEIFKQQLKTN